MVYDVYNDVLIGFALGLNNNDHGATAARRLRALLVRAPCLFVCYAYLYFPTERATRRAVVNVGVGLRGHFAAVCCGVLFVFCFFSLFILEWRTGTALSLGTREARNRSHREQDRVTQAAGENWANKPSPAHIEWHDVDMKPRMCACVLYAWSINPDKRG